MATEPLTLQDLFANLDYSCPAAITERGDGTILFLGHIDLTEALTRLGRRPTGYAIDPTTVRHIWAVFDRHEQICAADLEQDHVCFCWERSAHGWFWREVTAGAAAAVALTVADLHHPGRPCGQLAGVTAQ